MDGELSVHFDTLVVEIVTLLREDKHIRKPCMNPGN